MEIEIRSIDIDGETDWHWIKEDNGAWTGPKNDWIESHKLKYFTHIKSFGTVLTAGANQGMYTRFYSKLFKRVYAFEPDPINFQCLVLNNPAENVFKFQAALDEEPGIKLLDRFSACNTGMHKISTCENERTVAVQCLTIDSLNLESLDLLQLDVEGHELPVIVGATDTISRCRPVVIGEQLKDCPYLESYGYKYLTNSVSDFIWVPE